MNLEEFFLDEFFFLISLYCIHSPSSRFFKWAQWIQFCFPMITFNTSHWIQVFNTLHWTQFLHTSHWIQFCFPKTKLNTSHWIQVCFPTIAFDRAHWLLIQLFNASYWIQFYNSSHWIQFCFPKITYSIILHSRKKTSIKIQSKSPCTHFNS